MSSIIISSSKRREDSGRFAPFIPSLELSAVDDELLIGHARAFVANAIDEYQHYRDGTADWNKWKEVRRSDTIRVFRERQSITKNDVDHNGVTMLPEVLAIGNVAGSVEDMMYGAIATSGTAMLVNSKSCDEGLVEAKVMRMIVAPARAQPFHHVSAKWFSFSLGSGGVFSLRDCTVIETTGVMALANHERVGYVLRHSVAFRGVPDLQPFGIVRANISSWAIYRESGQGMVQCFVKSFYELGSRTWHRAGLKSLVDRSLAMCKYGKCAEMKKLLRQLSDDNEWDVMGSGSRRARTTDESECAVCLSPLASSLLASAAKTCKICRHAVCAHCLEKKSVCLVADEQTQRVALTSVRICTPCVKHATQANSMRLQLEEVTPVDLKPSTQWNNSLTDSESSEYQI